MKLFTGWMLSAGLIFSAATANAQVPAPDRTGGPTATRVSDVGGAYAAMPPEGPLRGGPMITGFCRQASRSGAASSTQFR